MTDWKTPQEPRFTHLFVVEQMAENEARGSKPKAHDTPFRFSDSAKCSRYLAYSALGYPGEPFDAASTFVTGLGTMLHELVQEAIGRQHGDAQFEIASRTVYSSGHTDGLIPTDDLGLVQYELKTMGGTAYKKSIGINNKGMGTPGGPRFSAIVQAALNAQANGCDTVVIGHIALEAVSKQLAARTGLPELNRFIAEWVIPKEVWEPLADMETHRQTLILDDVHAGYLPVPIALDDDGVQISLNPDNARYWQCQYCSQRERCLDDGPGRVAIKKESE